MSHPPHPVPVNATRGPSRRSVIRTTAWSVPAIAVATAAPAFASSEAASVAWGASSGPVLSLGLLNGDASGGSLAAVSLLPDGPQAFTISNPGASALANLTATVVITLSSGLPLLDSKGVGVYAVNGDPSLVSGRTETPNTVVPLVAQTYDTSQTLSLADVPGGTNAEIPVTFGLTDSGVLGVSVLLDFAVSLTLFSGGTQVGDPTISSISLPVGLSVL